LNDEVEPPKQVSIFNMLFSKTSWSCYTLG